MNRIYPFLIVVSLFMLIGCAAADRSTPNLIQDLNSQDREIRLTAAWVLGQRKEIDAVPALINALKDSDKGVQYASIWSLHNIGTNEAKNTLQTMIPLLEGDLKDSDPEVRKTAAEILEMIGTQEAKIILEEHKIDE